MTSRSLTLETQSSVAIILQKAADCFALAEAQHEAADQQHLHAENLEELGHALEVSAVEIQGKAILDVGRGRG